MTLALTTALQTAALGAWLTWREPGQVRAVLARWRRTALVGVASMLGSLGWFTAFALAHAALVKAVGQSELVFSLLGGWLVFGERMSRRELAAIALITLSVLALILAV